MSMKTEILRNAETDRKSRKNPDIWSLGVGKLVATSCINWLPSVGKTGFS